MASSIEAQVAIDPFFRLVAPAVERMLPEGVAPGWNNAVEVYRSLYTTMRFGPVSAGANGTHAPWFYTYDEFAGHQAPFPLVFMLASAAAYLALVYLVAPAMRPTTPAARATVARVRYWHNVALCLFSGVCFAGALRDEISSGELLGGSASLLCATSVPGYVVHLNIAFLASKVWEWFDTVLLVWAAPDFRKLSFLHVYHHATTLWLFATVANFPACTKMGMVLNGGVHTLMYAHYAWSFPKPLVPLITAAQIGQLAFTVFMWVATPGVCGGRFEGFANDEHPVLYGTPYSFVPVYLCFFLRFFLRRYVFRTSHHHSRRSQVSKSD